MKLFLIYIVLFFIPFFVVSQNKVPLNQNMYDSWNSLNCDYISNNGKWVHYEINPQKGDGKLYLVQPKTSFRDSFERGYYASFSPESSFLVFKIKAQADSIRKAKLEHCKSYEMPKDSLGIYVLNSSKLSKLERIKSYKLAKKSGNWLCVLHTKPASKKDLSDKLKCEKKKKVYKFEIINPVSGDSFVYENVTDYIISDDGNKIAFVSCIGDSQDSCKLELFDTKTKKQKTVFSNYGLAKALTFDAKGEQLCFIHSSDTTENKVYSLYYLNTSTDKAKLLIDTTTVNMPDNYSVSTYTSNWFSDDGKKLFFYIGENPKPITKDTILEEDKVYLDIWNWKDDVIQPEQLNKLSDDRKQKFLSVINIAENNFYQICNSKIKYCRVPGRGNVEYAMGLSDSSYLKERSWDSDLYRDVYLVNLENGKHDLILEKQTICANISPRGKYLIWYNVNESSWYTLSTETRDRHKISGNLSVLFTDEKNDKPKLADMYGLAGWTKNDKYVLVYDRYDIWKMDPTGKRKPLRLTNGRENKLSYRNVRLDSEQDYIDINKSLFLKYFDENTKGSGYVTLSTRGKMKILNSGDYSFYRPYKARDVNTVIWSRMSFTEYPDVWISDLKFTYKKKLSNTNPQQSRYLWGSTELVKWKLDGEDIEGILYKPENFDPNKKYPMIVYFYETYSDKLHNYYSPKPSRSAINFTTYVSNGYFVFIPDIHYKEGYPGESAVKTIISGTEELLKRPYIDKERLGVQGHSWGGYQVAFLITRTNMFKVAMAGAPVSNMTSSYGGIRWESGKSRMFQYEDGQSRLGVTLWENRDLYIENSPLFFADKIETPLLMMHNDHDGAVPWYQGIELFLALRRLNKPVFMLNYNGEDHNLKKRANQMDFTRRMQQYFDYYLKDAPIPEWMAKGVPAIEKGKNDGFKLMKQ